MSNLHDLSEAFWVDFAENAQFTFSSVSDSGYVRPRLIVRVPEESPLSGVRLLEELGTGSLQTEKQSCVIHFGSRASKIIAEKVAPFLPAQGPLALAFAKSPTVRAKDWQRHPMAFPQRCSPGPLAAARNSHSAQRDPCGDIW